MYFVPFAIYGGWPSVFSLVQTNNLFNVQVLQKEDLVIADVKYICPDPDLQV